VGIKPPSLKLAVQPPAKFSFFRIPTYPTPTAFIKHLTSQARAREVCPLVSIPAIMAIPMLLEGHGIAFLPGSFVREQLNRGELVALQVSDLPWLTQDVYLVKLVDRQLDQHRQAFVHMIKAQ
jgi:DNA-binding transcriptional LysR family regulator